MRPIPASICGSFVVAGRFARLKHRTDLACGLARSSRRVASKGWDDKLTLNVGGRMFETTEKTLRAVKDSRLCDLLLQYAETYSGGRKSLFIDRDGQVGSSYEGSCLPV